MAVALDFLVWKVITTPTNYQIAIWKISHIAQPDIPHPWDNHGWTKKTGVLEPLWFKEEEVVPDRMVDMEIDAVSNETVSDDEDVNFLSQDPDSSFSSIPFGRKFMVLLRYILIVKVILELTV